MVVVESMEMRKKSAPVTGHAGFGKTIPGAISEGKMEDIVIMENNKMAMLIDKKK